MQDKYLVAFKLFSTRSIQGNMSGPLVWTKGVPANIYIFLGGGGGREFARLLRNCPTPILLLILKSTLMNTYAYTSLSFALIYSNYYTIQ